MTLSTHMESPKCVRHFKVYEDKNDTAFIGGKLTNLQTENMFKQVKCVVRNAIKYLKNTLWKGPLILLEKKIEKGSLDWGAGWCTYPRISRGRGEGRVAMMPEMKKSPQGSSRVQWVGLVGEVSGMQLKSDVGWSHPLTKKDK